ncbi:uncharacterized protein LOC141644228 [Silene latifolia]|uniref:uncharacterized protein LOC141644228 n=1 Tax=Silene latifolia TaxID=37657 RepID=UPI003D771950
MHAELLALLAGLERAKQIRIVKLIIHMDNESCIQLVKEEHLVSNSLKSVVKRCKDLIKERGNSFKLEHTYRELNRAAGWLANRGVNSGIIPILLEYPPMDLHTILREDIFGLAIPRAIAN